MAKHEHYFVVNGDESIHLHSENGTAYELAVDNAGALTVTNEATGAVSGVGGGGGKYKQPEWGASTEIVDILPETTFEVSEETGGMAPIMEPLPCLLAEGETYEVDYNGASYSCVCRVRSGDTTTEYNLGNTNAIGDESAPATDEPFAIAFADETTAAEMGYYGVVVPLDGSTTITLSIKGPSGEIKTIPQKYVEPAPVPPLRISIVGQDVQADDNLMYTLNVDVTDIRKAIVSGRMVYFDQNGRLFGLLEAQLDVDCYVFGFETNVADGVRVTFSTYEVGSYGPSGSSKTRAVRREYSCVEYVAQ